MSVDCQYCLLVLEDVALLCEVCSQKQYIFDVVLVLLSFYDKTRFACPLTEYFDSQVILKRRDSDIVNLSFTLCHTCPQQ